MMCRSRPRFVAAPANPVAPHPLRLMTPDLPPHNCIPSAQPGYPMTHLPPPQCHFPLAPLRSPSAPHCRPTPLPHHPPTRHPVGVTHWWDIISCRAPPVHNECTCFATLQTPAPLTNRPSPPPHRPVPCHDRPVLPPCAPRPRTAPCHRPIAINTSDNYSAKRRPNANSNTAAILSRRSTLTTFVLLPSCPI